MDGNSFSILYSLERMRPEWTEVLDETWDTLYADGFEQYQKLYIYQIYDYLDFYLTL